MEQNKDCEQDGRSLTLIESPVGIGETVGELDA